MQIVTQSLNLGELITGTNVIPLEEGEVQGWGGFTVLYEVHLYDEVCESRLPQGEISDSHIYKEGVNLRSCTL